MGKQVLDYLGYFLDVFEGQLISDQARWGDTWKQRPREGQVGRIFAKFNDYKDQFDNAGVPIPWEKVVGEALIGWIRDKYPDTYNKE